MHAPLMAMPRDDDAIVPDGSSGCPLPRWRLVGSPADRQRHRHDANPGLPLDKPLAEQRTDGAVGGHFNATPAGSIWFAGDTGHGDGAIFGCASISARPTLR